MRMISLGRLLGLGIVAYASAACTSGGEEPDTTSTDDSTTDDSTTDTTSTDDSTTDDSTTDDSTTDDSTGDTGEGNPGAVACLPANEALLLDFTYNDGAGGGSSTTETDATFGDFYSTLSGGTFPYGESINSDMTGSNWHITGSVDSYSGFGFYFGAEEGGCTKFDASMFSGIKFTISGDTDGTPITLNVGTASNEISSVWATEQGETEVEPNFGRCEPAMNRYDGTCGNPTYSFMVTDTPTTIEVPWADLKGGAPSASVNPKELTFIGWNFTPPVGVDTDGVMAYDVDIVVDDIGFIE